MANEKRLVNLDKVIERLKKAESVMCSINGIKCVEIGGMLNFMETQPTVDAVEVMRCKDCKHWTMGYCNHFAYYSYEPITSEDDFCSYGERNGDGNG